MRLQIAFFSLPIILASHASISCYFHATLSISFQFQFQLSVSVVSFSRQFQIHERTHRYLDIDGIDEQCTK